MFVATPIVCGAGPYVDRPFARTAHRLAGSEADLDVSIKSDRSVYVGTNVVLLRDLRMTLADESDRPLFLSADRTVPFALVQEVLRATRDAGFTKVALVTFEGTVLEAYNLGAKNL